MMLKATLVGAVAMAIATAAAAQPAPKAAPAPTATANTPRMTKLLADLKDPNGPVMVVAHRGCHTEEPENSLAAFQRCIAVGVDMIETDVQHTRDGVLVLMHDQTLDRTTNGTGRVDSYTLAELKKLRLKLGTGGPDAPLTNETIPTFEEALAVTDGQILVDLDAKGTDLKRVWADSLVLLERLGMLDQITVKMTAGRDDALMDQPILKRVNYLQRVVSTGAPLSQVVRTHQKYDPVAYTVVMLNLPYLDEGRKAVEASGTRIWVEPFWGATAGGYSDRLALYDPDANWGRLLDAGADMMLTDQPEALLFYLYGKGLRGKR